MDPSGGARRPIMFWHMVANKILTFITNLLYNNIISDMETGYKVFTRKRCKALISMPGVLTSNRIHCQDSEKKRRIYEVPITFNPRDYSGEEDRLLGCGHCVVDAREVPLCRLGSCTIKAPANAINSQYIQWPSFSPRKIRQAARFEG